MNTKAQFLGVFGLVVFVFGLISLLVTADSSHLWGRVHFAISAIALFLFVFFGGTKAFKSKTFKRASSYGAGVVVYSALFFGILSVANFFVYKYDFLRFDSTEKKIYTLAPQTEKILASLKNKVIIRAFYLGGIVDAGLEGLLNRVCQSSSKISWSAVDPEKNLRLAEQLGINEKETLHLAIDEPNSTRVVKISRKITEQDLANSILKLTRGAEKKLYYIYGHGEGDFAQDTGGGFLFLKEAIEGENLKLEELILSGREAIPEDAAALIWIGPRRELLSSEYQLVENYLANGGNALFLSEPKSTGDIGRLVKNFGIEVGDDMVLSQFNKPMVGVQLGVQPAVTDYGNHPITEEFRETTVYATASSVRKMAVVPAGTIVGELAYTNKNSWAEKKVDLIFGDNAQATFETEDIKGPVSIAAASQGKGRIVVIGDIDFAANLNIRQVFNRDFVLNSLNWVVGETERISLRERTLRGSILTLSAEEVTKLFLVTGVILPELLLLCGLCVWWFRR
jgi:ABC-type uncharacterized transport system